MKETLDGYTLCSVNLDFTFPISWRPWRFSAAWRFAVCFRLGGLSLL
jgi:hypothetical protein